MVAKASQHNRSHDSHAIEITGGNTCTFLQCYAQRIPATHYGYRIYSRALMLACNGINTPGGWGLFGQSATDGDAVNMPGRITCINCNIEGHTTEGIRIKSDARANFINCTFLAGATGTYQSHLRIDYGSEMVELDNCTFASSGAVLAAGRTRPISSAVTALIKAIGCNETEYQGSFGITKFASESVVPNGYLISGTGLNSARIGLLSIIGPSQSRRSCAVSW